MDKSQPSRVTSVAISDPQLLELGIYQPIILIST